MSLAWKARFWVQGKRRHRWGAWEALLPSRLGARQKLRRLKLTEWNLNLRRGCRKLGQRPWS